MSNRTASMTHEHRMLLAAKGKRMKGGINMGS